MDKVEVSVVVLTYKLDWNKKNTFVIEKLNA